MEQNSDLVSEGRLIHETTYSSRPERFKELELDGIKIDFYDAKNKIVHEVKKSDKKKEAHVWQLKYYIYVLLKAGIDGVMGILEYPTLRKKEEFMLSSVDEELITQWKNEIKEIIESDTAPERIVRSKCRGCSYFDFCWISEDTE